MAKKKITYNEALSEIEQIIESIENNEFEVDELSLKVKRVSELLSFCKDKLHKTEIEIENILKEID